MEAIATIDNVPLAPRKLRLVADAIRKLSPVKAGEHLMFMVKSGAPILAKLVKEVIANAKIQNLKPEDLIFKKIEVNEGRHYAMIDRSHSYRGGRGEITKRRSHIKIVVESNNGTKD